MTLRALLLSSAVLLGSTPVFAQELDSMTTMVLDLNAKDIDVAEA